MSPVNAVRRHLAVIVTAAVISGVAAPAHALQGAPAAPPRPASSISDRTGGFEKRDGFIPVYVNDRTGQLLLEIPRDSTRLLFLATLASGLGSNPIGLDRGSGGTEQVTRFERAGDRMMVTFENTTFRSSGGADNRRSVSEAFPTSTVFALPILADENGRLLVDATDFVLRDWNDIAATLQRSQQGAYVVARDRSRAYKPYTKAFPDNSEIDIQLTFVPQAAPGGALGRFAPDPRALDFHQHISLIRLPDAAFRPRAADPRVGFFGVSFKDYAQPIQAQLEQHWAARHRLERTNANDGRSGIKKPIVFYVDRGIPEPLRTATLEGVGFWTQAFDRAGLTGGFRVELLPEGVDPMDVRYNVVQWINRNERGWSVGGALTDPRTGEMLKGMARMDSHRNRTDYNIYAAFAGADVAAADTAFVLARIRQVSAHEVGHTLGLGHNYIASTYERGSLMDYPAPRIRVKNGELDLSAAYDKGPGAYDVWAIRWGYGIYPPASERDSLAAIVKEGLGKGYLYLSDGDARPENAADPRTNLWDDAATAGEFLNHQMDARRLALSRFGLRNIRVGEPLSILQDRFPLLYFFHRFALNGVTKTLGGVEYANSVRGDGQQATRLVSPARQREAMKQLLAALDPKELAIPDTVLTLFSPRLDATGNVEMPGTRTYPLFDELGAARTLSQMIVDGILQRERAARMVQNSLRQASGFTFSEAVRSLVGGTWNGPPQASPKLAAIQRSTQRAVADRLIQLAADKDASPEVRAIASYEVGRLRTTAAQRATAAAADDVRAHWFAIADDFRRWQEKGEVPVLTLALRAPPGDPFGDDGWVPWPETFYGSSGRATMQTSPRSSSSVARRRALAIAWLAVLFASFLAVSADAQVVTRRRDADPDDGPARTFVGGALTYAQPQGEFKNYVNGAIGAVGHMVHAFDEKGIVGLRLDAGVLIYGSTTNRQPLGGGALGLVNVDVTTSNNIVFGGVGLQLMAPSGSIRPYASGTVGFSYFFTESSVEGQNNETPFANSQNFDDGGFTTMVGAGLYVPVRSGRNPIALDLGFQMHTNNDVQYLTKSSITIANSSSAPVITPVRSAADFITFRLGVSVGVR